MATIMKVRVERVEELICVDCGATFASHGACDGLEQLCNDCYVAQFTSQHPVKTAGLEISLVAPSSLQ
jgi:hypothetical protein